MTSLDILGARPHPAKESSVLKHLGNIFVVTDNIAQIWRGSDQRSLPHVNVRTHCCFKGGAAASAGLEEIMEQEETSVPLTSAASTDAQEEESGFNKSAEVSLPSPSPDTDIPSSISMKSSGEDQARDLSSDDK